METAWYLRLRKESLHILTIILENTIKKLHIASTGKGEFIIGLTKDQARLDNRAGEFIGSISSVNMFNMVLDSSVIFWMMHGCGEKIANAILPWSQFIDGFVGDVDIERPALCRDSEGLSIDCEQSLFCSKIRRETRKEELETTSACAARMSRMPSRSFSLRIFEQKRDCSQSSLSIRQ